MLTEFTPFASLTGGVMIGLAVVILMIGLGRIAGISGIVRGLFTISFSDVWWRLAFLTGLIGAPYIFNKLTGTLPDFAMTGDPYLIVAGGLLVGFGTSLGNGCTSGHGVCGLARLSKRSLVATLVFMLGAIVTVFIMRHVM